MVNAANFQRDPPTGFGSTGVEVRGLPLAFQATTTTSRTNVLLVKVTSTLFVDGIVTQFLIHNHFNATTWQHRAGFGLTNDSQLVLAMREMFVIPKFLVIKYYLNTLRNASICKAFNYFKQVFGTTLCISDILSRH